MNRSFKYGDGFFETIRVIDQKVPLYNYHKERVLKSFNILNYDHQIEFVEASFELLLENAPMGLNRGRITYFRAGEGTYAPLINRVEIHTEVFPIIEHSNPIFSLDDLDKYSFLSKVESQTPMGYQIYRENYKSRSTYSTIKSTSAILYVLASQATHEYGEGLILNDLGNVIESTFSNIYCVKEGVIYTPPLSEGCVEGVYRAYLMDQFDCQERSISEEFLEQADMVFVSNALKGVRRLV
jgi:branched-chain amino acid aminotransferase